MSYLARSYLRSPFGRQGLELLGIRPHPLALIQEAEKLAVEHQGQLETYAHQQFRQGLITQLHDYAQLTPEQKVDFNQVVNEYYATIQRMLNGVAVDLDRALATFNRQLTNRK